MRIPLYRKGVNPLCESRCGLRYSRVLLVDCHGGCIRCDNSDQTHLHRCLWVSRNGWWMTEWTDSPTHEDATHAV